MTRQGVKPAAQDRAKKTRDKLLAAFESLLKEKSFESMSVAEIAGRAGLSVGAVYRRFENKDAFIPVIFDLYRERVEALAGSPEGQYSPDLDAGLRTALRGMTAMAWGFLKREGHLVRAAHLYARLRPDLVGDEWEAMIEMGVASYRLLVEAFADEVARPDADEAARVLFYLLNTSMIEYGLYREDGPGAALSIGEAGFTDAMADAMYGYLTVPEI